MKLKIKQTVFIGLAFLSISMFWRVYDSIIPKILINTFGLNQAHSGIIMALDNILALFLLPLFGHLSDKTSTKYGKRTPYIVVGTILTVAFVCILALLDGMQINLLELNGIKEIVRDDYIINGVFDNAAYQAAIALRQAEVSKITNQNILLLISFIGVLVLVVTSLSIYRTPTIALMPDVTPKPLRSQANAIINLLGTTGGILALVVINMFSKDYYYYLPLFVIIAVIMIVFLIIFLVGIHENKLLESFDKDCYCFDANDEMCIDNDEKMDKSKRRSFILLLVSIFLWYMGFNAVTSKFSIYAQNVLGMNFAKLLIISEFASLLSFIPIGYLTMKVSRKSITIFGIVIITFSSILGYFAGPESEYLLVIVMILAGIGWASISVNSYPMIVELCKGCNIGKFTAYYYVAALLGQSITPILSGYLMDAFSMNILFPYSAICFALALVTMIFVHNHESKIKHRTKMEVFDDEE